MKILLFGEYSNVYNTLAQGLRKLGHNAKVISGGDNWKNYNRDIDISARNSKHLLFKLLSKSHKIIGYDVVQFINPLFTFSGKSSLFLNKKVFNYLKRFNKKVFLSAMGEDSFWTQACMNNMLDYDPLSCLKNHTDFTSIASNALLFTTEKVKNLNQHMANHSSAIIAGAYEYFLSYKQSEFSEKTTFIPFPVNTDSVQAEINERKTTDKVKIFIGVQKNRSIWKGTDIILEVLHDYNNKYPHDIDIKTVTSVPYNEYKSLMNDCDVVFDQLYSFSPAINGLLAMAKGKILFGGGEPSIYELLNETENFPIFNIKPDKNQIISQLNYILENRNKITQMKIDSRKFVEKHHNYINVAQQYLKIWTKS